MGERSPLGRSGIISLFDERFGHTVGITIMTEDLPEEHNLVTARSETRPTPMASRRSRWSTLSARIPTACSTTASRGPKEVMEAAGAKQIMTSRLRRNAGWHLLGTARMG